MEESTLKNNWMKLSKAAFDQFIEENIGYKENPDGSKGDVPKCFDSGDAHPWCEFCQFQIWC